MELDELAEKFEYYNKEYMQFDKITDPESTRPDLCAFIIIDKLFPGNKDIISAASHDEIYLDVSAEKLAEIATDELIIKLTRCGVHFDEENDSLALFT